MSQMSQRLDEIVDERRIMLVEAVKCPTCGVAENGLVRLPAKAFHHPWYCADCPQTLPPEDRRLLFSVTPT